MQSLAMYLRYGHALSYQRSSELFQEVFGLSDWGKDLFGAVRSVVQTGRR